MKMFALIVWDNYTDRTSRIVGDKTWLYVSANAAELEAMITIEAGSETGVSNGFRWWSAITVGDCWYDFAEIIDVTRWFDLMKASEKASSALAS